MLLLRQFGQLSHKNFHGHVLILMLTSLVLTCDHDACRQMGNSDGRISLVYMLTSCAAAPVGIDSQIIGIDFHIYFFV